jgi:uncharacterized lipoprotein YmbA
MSARVTSNARGHRLIAPLLAGVLVGCASSPPVQFYALEPTVPESPAVHGTPGILQITRVRIPPVLDRQQIVRESAPYRIEINDQNRWSAPVDQMIQQVLTRDLLRILPPGNVALPRAPTTAETRRIVVDILRFAADPANTIQLEANWSVMSTAPDTPACTRSIKLSQPAASSSYTDIVQSMSAVLGQASVQIAAASASCPANSPTEQRPPR